MDESIWLRISTTKLSDFGKGLNFGGWATVDGLGRYPVAVSFQIFPMDSEGEADMLNVMYKPDIK